MSGITAQAQQDLGEDSESVIIMSEDDIKSLAKILIEYKKNKADNVALNTSQIATTELMRLEKDSYEVDYLRNQIAQLENVIERINNSKATSNSSFDNDSNSLNRRELNNIKNDISQLKNLIQQLDNRTNNDLTVVVSSNELETKSFISPNESIIGEKIGYNDKQTIILENKLDSLNMLLKNLKTSDNPNYIDHFNVLEKRIEALKTELNLKQSQPDQIKEITQ